MCLTPGFGDPVQLICLQPTMECEACLDLSTASRCNICGIWACAECAKQPHACLVEHELCSICEEGNLNFMGTRSCRGCWQRICYKCTEKVDRCPFCRRDFVSEDVDPEPEPTAVHFNLWEYRELFGIHAVSQPVAHEPERMWCAGITVSGAPCRRPAMTNTFFCYHHG